METFERTGIWEKTLSGNNANGYEKEVEELRSSFFQLRKNIYSLVSRISSTLPDLTQHEITHLDALWDTASLIVGNNFPINPLEAFVLGCSILLHDSALCYEAYENGQEGIRDTVEWKDAYSELIDNHNQDDLKDIADFAALRELHAKQAASLLAKSWRDPDNNQEWYLLENQTLRKHFGKLIGEIAASHHWDIETVASKLSNQQNTLPSYPREWRIDAVKIACILRCADAAHIDNLRAPDFLHALLKRNGVSFHHWQAQNRLSKVDVDQSDQNKETLLFTSTMDFSEKEADSWFVAYDAICLVDKEIKSSNSLLLSENQNISFKIKKVKGVESPERLSKYIKVEGWKPCSSQVHVGNIENLIHNLGGEMLYGTGSDLLGVAICELIQNARDSINARVYVDRKTEGVITFKIEKIEEDMYFTIEDNGVGMSERVLTGPLLDFGSSFWTSNLIKSEFPGLRSSQFKSVGKFGVGFYSIFMIAEEVFVSSKNWDKGLPETHQLKFKNGFTLRPIIKKGYLDDFHPSTSTQIRVKLKPNILNHDLMVEIKTNRMNAKNFNVPFDKYLSALCSGINTPVDYIDNLGNKTRIHEKFDSSKFDKLQWLKNISFSDYNVNSNSTEYISQNINRLKLIMDNTQLIGFAAISTTPSSEQDFLSISTIGGLAHSVHQRDGDNYIGYIDFTPKSAKRDIGEIACDKKTIKKWAQDQLDELVTLQLNPFESYSAASSLCHFKVDPTQIAKILVIVNNESHFYTIEGLAELSKSQGIAFLESGFGEHIETHHSINALDGYALVKPLNNGSFLSLKMENEVPEKNNSIFDCLYRSILAKGTEPMIKSIDNIATNSFGQGMNAIIISSNS